MSVVMFLKWPQVGILKSRASSQYMGLAAHKIWKRCMQPVWLCDRAHILLKSAHFCLFFAHKSAILIFFKNQKKSSGRVLNALLWPKLQISSTYCLCYRSTNGRTDGRTDGQTDRQMDGRAEAQTAGKPISPFGLCEPMGDKNPECRASSQHMSLISYKRPNCCMQQFLLWDAAHILLKKCLFWHVFS